MKITTLIPGIFLTVILFVNTNCKKEPPLQILPERIIKIAYAGVNQYIFLPTNNCQLAGQLINNANQIEHIEWKKISGPSNFIIVNPDSLKTTITNLERGTYEFELTILVSGGLNSKDTCMVIVGEISPNPTTIILQNQEWIIPWYNTIRIQNFNSLVPPQLLRKIYIKRDGNPDWIEVDFDINNYNNGGLYFFSLYGNNNGTLDIYYFGNDASDTPDVKIVF